MTGWTLTSLQVAPARFRQLERLRKSLWSRLRLGEVDRENDALVHDRPPSKSDVPLQRLPTNVG